MPESSLAIMSRASTMLAQATTVQKAKELKDLALTAADWARRKGMGEEAIQHCRSYAMLAEIRMGEMLAATERAKGAKGVGPPIAVAPRNRNDPPTLAALGISKRESAEAQRLAALPKLKQEALVAGKISVAEILQPKPHVAQNSGDNEWYTPKEYIERNCGPGPAVRCWQRGTR